MPTKVQQFRKMPEPVDAIQFTGDNVAECREFLGDPQAMHNAKEGQLFIKTALSETPVHKNWWIIRDSIGYRTMDPVVFANQFEPVKVKTGETPGADKSGASVSHTAKAPEPTPAVNNTPATTSQPTS